MESFNSYYKSLFSNVYIKSFAHGPIPQDKALNIIKNIQSQFFDKQAKPIKEINVKNYSNHHSELSPYFVYREKLRNIYNINHAIINFYQIGDENLNNILLANIVKELCGYIYFTELRIKQQLGYTTKGNVFSEGNIIVNNKPITLIYLFFNIYTLFSITSY